MTKIIDAVFKFAMGLYAVILAACVLVWLVGAAGNPSETYIPIVAGLPVLGVLLAVIWFRQGKRLFR